MVSKSEQNLITISGDFRFFDLNGDGVIGRSELHQYFKSDKIVDGIIERLDKNKDGVISYSGINYRSLVIFKWVYLVYSSSWEPFMSILHLAL